MTTNIGGEEGSMTCATRAPTLFSLDHDGLRASSQVHVHFANLIRGCIANLGEPFHAEVLHEGGGCVLVLAVVRQGAVHGRGARCARSCMQYARKPHVVSP